MTSFGRTQREEAAYSVTVEMRTLNGRYLDIILRLPKNCMEFEEPLRKRIGQVLKRGRVEVFAQIETKSAQLKAPRINPAVARLYWDQLQELHRQLPGTDAPKLEHLLSIPHLYEPAEGETDRDLLGNLLMGAVDEALEQLRQMRCREGEALVKDMNERVEALEKDLGFIESRKDAIIEEYRKRLRDRVQELLGDLAVDENRLLQEVACMAERSDINEEIVRLKSHIGQMRSALRGSKDADGRRLDFMSQELHREVNTIGCKTGDLDVAQAVVRMKSEIGKLKEQVQNIE